MLAAAVALALPAAATASSEDAWDSFRQEVEAACIAAAAPLMTGPTARVDPFGSASYGLALLSGTAIGSTDATVEAICVFDKATKAVEIGGELPPASSDP
jgi:hypothetical protein